MTSLIPAASIRFDKEGYTPAILGSTQLAIEEADIIVFIVDGREEPTTLDFLIADVLRRTKKPIIVAANKMDALHQKPANHYALRLGEVINISGASGFGRRRNDRGNPRIVAARRRR